ncbi:MAG TPA: GTPase ObgE [Candidatus Ozemobacteraceae bacterium]|nr:GTPase ObgE [Candidatus Ozemobacteraceae bacterium]
MKFVDELVIQVSSGKGGDGMVAFRREKFVPFGGPSGGDGGRGGDVILEATRELNTLYDLSFRREYEADSGGKGGPKDKTGFDAAPLTVLVPAGTLVYDEETGELLCDLDAVGKKFLAAKGGRGGRGNAKFVSSVRRAPRFAEKGEPLQTRRLRLALKLLADVGLVGLPNAGKSTLLSVVSRARPKIADYPFTTLVPELGIVKIDGLPSFCMADLPGLIEGAHEGAGLGIRFLKHTERTRALVHVIDVSAIDPEEPLASFSTVMKELKAFSKDLAKKPQIVAANKMDLPDAREAWGTLQKALKRKKIKVFPISGATHEGLDDLVRGVAQMLKELPAVEPAVVALPRVERRTDVAPSFRIDAVRPHLWEVTGNQIERWVEMTDFTNEESVRRFKKRLKTCGFIEALADIAADLTDTVVISSMEFEYREFFA